MLTVPSRATVYLPSTCTTDLFEDSLSQILHEVLRKHSPSFLRAKDHATASVPMTSVTMAHFYLHSKRIKHAYSLAAFHAMVAIVENVSAWETSDDECPAAGKLDPRVLATHYERLWAQIWGCAEPIQGQPTFVALDTAQPRPCPCYVNASNACLVHEEVSCTSCRDWHTSRGRRVVLNLGDVSDKAAGGRRRALEPLWNGK